MLNILYRHRILIIVTTILFLGLIFFVIEKTYHVSFAATGHYTTKKQSWFSPKFSLDFELAKAKVLYPSALITHQDGVTTIFIVNDTKEGAELNLKRVADSLPLTPLKIISASPLYKGNKYATLVMALPLALGLALFKEWWDNAKDIKLT